MHNTGATYIVQRGGSTGVHRERCGLFRTGVKPPIEGIGASNGEGGKYKGTIYFARGMCA